MNSQQMEINERLFHVSFNIFFLWNLTIDRDNRINILIELCGYYFYAIVFFSFYSFWIFIFYILGTFCMSLFENYYCEKRNNRSYLKSLES